MAKLKMTQEQAERLLNTYADHFNAKREHDENMKQLREKLEEWAEHNEELFNGKNTLTLEGGKLVYKLKTTVKTCDKFNPTEFLKAYPDAVDVKVKPSKLINIDLESWGIEKQEERIFAVEVSK